MWEVGRRVRRTGTPVVAHTSPVQTGDEAERELFERLEREFAHVKVPRARPRRARSPRAGGGMPKTKRLLLWVVVLGLGTWGFSHTSTGRSLAAAFGWGGTADAASGDGYTFTNEVLGTPVRWSSCRPIEVVVNDALRPLDATNIVGAAIAEVAAASGLTIRLVGSTDEQPSDRRPVEQSRYGVSWAPVLVAWTTPDVDPGLTGDTVGMGGGTAVTRDGLTRYVSGQVTLDTPQLEEMLALPNGEAMVRAVVVHELAHVLGLGHVDDPSALMAERGGATSLGRGDRAGLRVAGSGPCL